MLLPYGQENVLPDSNMSLMSVSIGVFPTNLTKNSCSITAELTVLRLGRRRSSLPNLVGWFGYCERQYSSRAHWDFSWMDSMCATSLNPHASATIKKHLLNWFWFAATAQAHNRYSSVRNPPDALMLRHWVIFFKNHQTVIIDSVLWYSMFSGVMVLLSSIFDGDWAN